MTRSTALTVVDENKDFIFRASSSESVWAVLVSDLNYICSRRHGTELRNNCRDGVSQRAVVD